MFCLSGGTGRLHDEQNFLNGAKIGRVLEFQGTGFRVQVAGKAEQPAPCISYQPSIGFRHHSLLTIDYSPLTASHLSPFSSHFFPLTTYYLLLSSPSQRSPETNSNSGTLESLVAKTPYIINPDDFKNVFYTAKCLIIIIVLVHQKSVGSPNKMQVELFNKRNFIG